MAYYVTTQSASSGRLSRWISSLFADFVAWRDAVATRNALARLTDAELCDIGLTRADIDHMSDADLRNG